jgi:hypothetical protein
MSSHGSLQHRTALGGRPVGRHRREPDPGTARRKIVPALVLAGFGAATAAASAHGIVVPAAHVSAHAVADSLSVTVTNRPWMY